MPLLGLWGACSCAREQVRKQGAQKSRASAAFLLAVTQAQGRVIGADATLRKSVMLALRPDTWTA